MRLVLAATTVAIGLVGLWLVSVVVLILPGRDPGSIPIWTAFTAIALGASATSAVVLTRAGGPPVAGGGRIALLAVAVVSEAAGFILLDGFFASPAGEDYLLLVGGAFATHGVVALWTAISRLHASR